MYKLIRDNIPDVMQSKGKKCYCAKIVEDELFQEVLLSKLQEECGELVEAIENGSNIIEEMVDVMTVLNTIKSTLNLSDEELNAYYDAKAKEKGLFTKRLLGFFHEDE